MSEIFLNVAMSICFVAGKSGGHLLPSITEANSLLKANPSAQVYIFSSGSKLDHDILKKHTHIHHRAPVELENPPYSRPWAMPWFLCKTGLYFVQALRQLYTIKPAKVVSFGGFVAIPVCLAAKALWIPIELYELNVEPGKSTKFLSKFTDTVYTCFESTKKYFPNKKCIHFDYPIRFTNDDKIFDRNTAMKNNSLSPDRKTILILGGSQGSVLLNEVMKETIDKFPELDKTIQIIHQTGAQDSFDYADFYKKHGIPAQVFSYSEKLQDFYNLADVIVSRAGAGTLFEIKFFGKKCITIPHETAHTNHQIENVLELQKEFPDQFIIIKQPEFSADTLMVNLNKLL